MGFAFYFFLSYNVFYTKEGCLDMESITMESFVEKRMKENKDLFTKEEWQWIRENKRGTHKIYLLGAMNCRECYENRDFTD